MCFLQLTLRNGSPAAINNVLKPTGGNAGTWDPYPENEGCTNCGVFGEDQPMMVNGQRVKFMVDYTFTISYAQFKSFVGNDIAKKITGPDLTRIGIVHHHHETPDGADDENTIRIGSYVDWYEIVGDGDGFVRRRVTSFEAEALKQAVINAADNTSQCRSYIKALIEQIARNAERPMSDIVSTNVEELFDAILNSRGGGEPGYGGIFVRAAKSVHSADNYWAWVGNPGFAQINLSYGKKRWNA